MFGTNELRSDRGLLTLDEVNWMRTFNFVRYQPNNKLRLTVHMPHIVATKAMENKEPWQRPTRLMAPFTAISTLLYRYHVIANVTTVIL